MAFLTERRSIGLLVLGLVLTSFPARVWLFGACPVCGQIHERILLVCLGGDPANVGEDAADDESPDGCYPPLPYCPTASPEPMTASLASGDQLQPQSDSQLESLPATALIRPPRA